MVLDKTVNVEIISKSHATRYKNSYGIECSNGDIISVPIEKLKTSSYRRNMLNCICDDCGSKFTRRLDKCCDTEYDYCNKCVLKGDRHPKFGEPLSIETKRKISKKLSGENNPFYGKTHSDEVKRELSKLSKGNKYHAGHKHSDSVREKISYTVRKGYENGTRAKTHGNARCGKYKGLKYQGSYELTFLKYCDTLGVLDKITRGPIIKYKGLDGKQHYYLSDYFIEELNIVIEIKSTHFWRLKEETNKIKMKTALKSYKYVLVLDNKFEDFNNEIHSIME